MSIPLPNPSLFQKKPSTTTTVEEPQPAKSEAPKKPFVRKPHLTQNLREDGVLKEIMDELRESEEINRKAGWYDRNRNGRMHANKKPQRKSR